LTPPPWLTWLCNLALACMGVNSKEEASATKARAAIALEVNVFVMKILR
jgi:hypothetical protein